MISDEEIGFGKFDAHRTFETTRDDVMRRVIHPINVWKWMVENCLNAARIRKQWKA